MRGKKLMILTAQLFAILGIGLVATAQTDMGEGGSEEQYYKENTALTDFSRLGVNPKQYAKCVRVVNFLEGDKLLNVIRMGKEDFRDDGQGYDLVAGDGILTATNLAFYNEGDEVLPPGTYQGAKENYLVHDPLFNHALAEKVPFPRLKISCKTRWVPCSALPHPINLICQQMGPPYGSLEFFDCQWELTFSLI